MGLKKNYSYRPSKYKLKAEKGGEQQQTIGGLSGNNSANNVHLSNVRNNGSMLPSLSTPNSTSSSTPSSQQQQPLSATAPTGHTTVPVVSATNIPNNHHHHVSSHHHHNIGSVPNGGPSGPPRDCAGCGKRITERFLLKALDLFWHEDCLKCQCCDCRLGEVGSTLYTKANLILCKRDYLRLFGTTGYCAACNKVIPAFEMVMRAKSNVYHLECFACQQCNHRFCVGDRFYLCENKILCEYDYEERLVFANMAYNPTSLAHIRRQVSNLQPPPTDHVGVTSTILDNSVQQNLRCEENVLMNLSTQTTQNYSNDKNNPPQSTVTPVAKNRNSASNHRGDDGSSGYGSPDSDTFDLANQPMGQPLIP